MDNMNTAAVVPETNLDQQKHFTVGALFENFESFKENCKYDDVLPAGYVYLIDLGNNRVKVGSSTKIIKRIFDHERNIRNYYGETISNKIFISEPMMNYREIESTIIKQFESSSEVIKDCSFIDILAFVSHQKCMFDLDLWFTKLNVTELYNDAIKLKIMIEKKGDPISDEVNKLSILEKFKKNYKIYDHKKFIHEEKFIVSIDYKDRPIFYHHEIYGCTLCGQDVEKETACDLREKICDKWICGGIGLIDPCKNWIDTFMEIEHIKALNFINEYAHTRRKRVDHGSLR